MEVSNLANESWKARQSLTKQNLVFFPRIQPQWFYNPKISFHPIDISKQCTTYLRIVKLFLRVEKESHKNVVRPYDNRHQNNVAKTRYNFTKYFIIINLNIYTEYSASNFWVPWFFSWCFLPMLAWKTTGKTMENFSAFRKCHAKRW